MKTFNNISIGITFLIFFSCLDEGINNPNAGQNTNPADSLFTNSGSESTDEWLIPKDQVIDGGPGKDGIPSLNKPEFSTLDGADYLDPEDLVIGVKILGKIKLYPHKILDWHEIINDSFEGDNYCLNYCPLTGTGFRWRRASNTFGVSGLLYNNNLILYDRKTDSNWSQFALQCVNGMLIGDKPVVDFIVEASWSTWKKHYPESVVLTTNTGHSRNYLQYPYGDYKSTDALFFPIKNLDNRLATKEKVHIIINENEVKVYQLSLFDKGENIIHDNFGTSSYIIIGSRSDQFIVSFKDDLINGEKLNIELINSNLGQESLDGSIMTDQFGNKWDIFGTALSGPNEGHQLSPSKSTMSYWFAVSPFYPNPKIYQPTN